MLTLATSFNQAFLCRLTEIEKFNHGCMLSVDEKERNMSSFYLQ